MEKNGLIDFKNWGIELLTNFQTCTYIISLLNLYTFEFFSCNIGLEKAQAKNTDSRLEICTEIYYQRFRKSTCQRKYYEGKCEFITGYNITNGAFWCYSCYSTISKTDEEKR